MLEHDLFLKPVFSAGLHHFHIIGFLCCDIFKMTDQYASAIKQMRTYFPESLSYDTTGVMKVISKILEQHNKITG